MKSQRMLATAKQRSRLAIGTAVAFAFVLAGCSSGGSEASEQSAKAEEEVAEAAEQTADAACEYPMVVTDMAGNEVTIDSADSVLVTDNRVFAVLNEWGVHPSAAPRVLMSPNNSWAEDETILDTGSHGEPDFDQVIVADPDLIINGYRYGDHADALKKAAPDAAFIDMTSDLDPHEFAVQSTTLMGEVFCKQDEAAALISDFDDAIAQTEAAYDPAMTVMGLVTSGNEIRYSNPVDGRGASIFFTLLDLTPALDEAGSTNHQGDDISIEAIAQANPGFFLVLDRDASFAGTEESTPALELINGSAALAQTPAVENQAMYIMPADYYKTEDIYAYIDVLDGLRSAFEAQK